MSTLTWVTPQTNIANFAKTTNSVVNISLSATDSNPHSTLTYSILAGNLPTGFELGADGTISGIPSAAYSQSSYFTYEFKANVTNGIDKLVGVFSITIINKPQLKWATPIGTIANLGVGLPANLELQAIDLANDGATITYSLISGSLPIGLTFNSDGTITGTPSIDNTSSYITRQTYSFVVRAVASDGATVSDAQFSIIVTNTINTDFSWITPAGVLGTLPNGEFYKFPLQTQTSSGATNITYSLVSGELPPGMQVVPTGYIQGVPTLLYPIVVNSNETYRFTIRASNNQGHVRDQAFSIVVTNYYAPIIEPSSTRLGTVFDGEFYSQEIIVNELSPNVVIQWANIGSLPPGLSITTTPNNKTYINGYLQPVPQSDGSSTAGYDYETVVSGNVVTFQQQYDYKPYDYSNLASRSITYTFTVQAYDGANYDLQTYILNVVSRGDYTADNANITIDTKELTVDSANVYYPVILNANVSTLPLARSNTNYAYKFEGYDYQGYDLTYLLSNSVGTFDADVVGTDYGFDALPFDSYDPNASPSGTLPGTLALDSTTGWLYGNIGNQSATYQEFKIGVMVTKTIHGNVYQSSPYYFQLPVTGNISNSINWTTSSNLGAINNGAISELSVAATSTLGIPLIYKIVDQKNVPVRLPQGLELLPSGEISGRVSFEVFSIDGGNTTFDKQQLTIDKSYLFTVQAITDDFTLFADGTYNVPPSATSIQQFSLTINVVDKKPYENLYLRAMNKAAERTTFNSLISNTEIFVPDLIYRPTDPWFGVAQDLTMLFLPGLNPSEVSSYVSAILENHYTKTYKFGDIDTAVVLDENFNVKYEVVYINVVDPDLNSMEYGPAEVLNLTGVISNPYIDSSGNTYTTVYPNSSVNMEERLVASIGYADQSTLPDWMTSNQPGNTAGTFKTPLGFTRAVVLAYTNPGQSKLIAYRIKNSGFDFNQIDFTVDRYLLDDYYTKNFNVTTGTYNSGRETTFDSSTNNQIGSIVATVDYAVIMPFDQLNARSIDYVNQYYGGLDGIKNFQSGDTLIFFQQEGFLNVGPADGWVNYSDLWIGASNVPGSPYQGYSTEGYDEYAIVPGYLEKIQGTSPINKRGGVWKISIDSNNIISLAFVQEVLPYDRIRVNFGGNYGNSVLYYNNKRVIGQSVPEYAIFKNQVVANGPTTFNGATTKFFSGRDRYYTPNSQDKYVKFPQFGVFT